MKVLVQYALGYAVDDWIMCESDLKDLRADACKEVLARRMKSIERLSNGWRKMQPQEEAYINSKLRITQFLPEGKF